jgi:uncharacterized protein YecA (UPF0149 family)
MDCRTGEIYESKIIEQLIASGAIADRSRFREMDLPPTATQLNRDPPRIGKYDPCPCGSGKKFKFCCLRDPSDSRFTPKDDSPKEV